MNLLERVLERVPPNDAFAESALLSGILTRPELISDVIPLIADGDFYREANREIFRAMLALDARHEPIDAVTLIAELRIGGKLEIAGGASRFAEMLAETIDVPAHAPAHAQVIRELAIRRELMASSMGLINAAFDGGCNSTELIECAQRDLDQLRDRGTQERPSTADVLHATLAHLDDDGAQCIPTGFRKLDAAIEGGMRRGEMVTLAGATGRGKSTLALGLAVQVAKSGGAALFLSLEMEERELARRAIFADAQVTHQLRAIGGISASEAERLATSTDELAKLKLAIEYRPGLRPMTVRARAHRFQRDWNALDLVVVDYIGLMRPDSRQERRERELASITRELKLLASELHCAVIAVAQVNREAVKRENSASPPRLSDLRDSGAIEQDSDAVWFLHEPEPERVVLVIAKNRRGPITTVPLIWRPSLTRFESAA